MNGKFVLIGKIKKMHFLKLDVIIQKPHQSRRNDGSKVDPWPGRDILSASTGSGRKCQGKRKLEMVVVCYGNIVMYLDSSRCVTPGSIERLTWCILFRIWTFFFSILAKTFSVEDVYKTTKTLAFYYTKALSFFSLVIILMGSVCISF